MNSDNDEIPQADTSLCWKCRYGMCVQETEIEKIIHPPMPGFPGVQQMDDPFSAREDSDGEEMVGHIIEQERVKTICFWRPGGVENAPPLMMALVSKCNRFEQKS